MIRTLFYNLGWMYAEHQVRKLQAGKMVLEDVACLPYVPAAFEDGYSDAISDIFTDMMREMMEDVDDEAVQE